MANIKTQDLPAATSGASVESVVVNTVDGLTQKLSKDQISQPIASQSEAETGATVSSVMTPLSTKQAVAYYSILKDYSLYPLKATPSPQDLLLINNSAAGGALAKIDLSQLLSSSSELPAATIADALALASNTVAITPFALDAVVTAKHGWSEKFVARSEDTVDINRTGTLLEGAAARVILPAADSGLEQCVIVNGTPQPVTIYPNEGRVASGAYFGGNTRISFPRTGPLGGLESSVSQSKLTGYVLFSADALPATGSQTLVSCTEKITGAFKGWELTYSSAVGKPLVFSGYGGTSSNATAIFTSPANPIVPGTVTELVWSFDLATQSFYAAINGVVSTWTKVFPAANVIVMPSPSQPISVGSGSYGSFANTTSPHIGNIFRVALWAGYFSNISVPLNLAAFTEPGRPKNIGATGWRVRGSWAQPASLYLNGAGQAFKVNRAPNFLTTSNVTGSVEGSNVVPPPANSGVLGIATMTVPGSLAEHTVQLLTQPHVLPINGRVAFGLIEGRTQYVIMGGA